MSEMKSSDMDLAAKRQALAALLRGQESSSPGTKRIQRRNNSGLVPLAFAQERLWFLEQYYPGTSLYNIPAAYPFQGPLNVDVFRASLNDLVRRHESLRTTLINKDGKPLQLIAPELVLDVPLIDLSQFSEEQRQYEAAKILNEQGARPFDLSQGPLLRAALIRMSDSYHVLSLTMHHIISDAWSMGVFINEFTTIYAARCMNQIPVLPELLIQYADFAMWQREWMHGEGFQNQLAYWKQELDGIESDRLVLPTDRPRPQTLTFTGASISALFSPKTSARLRALTQSAGVTPYITLLTGFKVLNYRYTRQPAIVVGMLTANRNRTELERIIGFFVNTLVLRTRLSGAISFQEALSRVRDVVLRAHAHQDLPFERLVEELQPARSLNTNPLFQVLFDYQNQSPMAGEQGPPAFPDSAPTPEQEGVQIVSAGVGTSKFDLTVSLSEVGQQFSCNVEYNTELFDEATIVRLIGHYHTLLDAAAADPTMPIGDLPLMTQAEKKQVLVDWNTTQFEFPSETCAHQQFEQWAERTPDGIAAVFESQQLSYRELNERSNRLARHLRKRGVGPEVVVGICLEPSLETVVAIFGVLKAGGAYLPLDASYPDDRLTFMLKDSETRLILTQPQLAEKVGRLGSFEVLVLENNADQFNEGDKTNLSNSASSRNTCYVIYTSGSTGRPKGIMIEHRNVLNLVHALGVDFGLGPGRRMLQFASFSFDQSVREVFETLLSGATLCLASREKKMPGESLLNILRDMEVSDVTLVPSVQTHLPHADLPALRTLTAGGEACPQDIVNRWGVGRRYFNAYGPSEVTFASSIAECFPGSLKPTIGRPMANVRYYVVDDRLQPVPIGIPGELLVGGLGQARGYKGRPDLTAERFIPDSFSGERGARLYRTGDLVRQLPDSRCDYLGRMDQQVKVRGFRIELGEIESVLLEHPAVSAAAVGCYNETGEEQLAAYVVSATEVSADELHSFLLQKLPDYMVPSVIIYLDQIPLTQAGKVDRSALPSPEAVRRQREHVAPRTPVEQVLANIWSEVLGIEHLSVHDNFFELGGHSLLITQIASRVRDALHTEIPIRLIFESPTIAQLATALSQDPENGKKLESTADLLVRLNELGNNEIEQLLQQILQGKKASAAVIDRLSDMAPATPLKPQTVEVTPEPALAGNQVSKISRRSENGHPPLSFAQERLWILDQFQPGNIAYNVFRPIPFSGPLNVAALKRSLEQLVQRHEVLRTTFQVADGRPVQVIKPSIEIDLRVGDLQDLSLPERQTHSANLLRELVLNPFDLAVGPLFRVLALKFGPAEHMLGLSIHHIVSDEHSIRILTRDLLELYEHNVSGRPLSLPPLPIQFADHAIWQREQMQGKKLEEHLLFWREQLAGEPAVIDLPTNHPRPAVPNFRGNLEPFECSRDLSFKFEKLSHQENVTMFMTMLAAYMALLYRYTSQEKIVVGVPIANRNRAEVENLIGFFSNTLVLPCDMAPRMTFRELLKGVREVTLKAYAHQDLPFERLVEELRPQRNLNINPLFQVMFVLQKDTGVFAAAAKGNNDQSTFPPDEITMAKFDLTLYMEETAEGLVGGFEYATELFERTTIRRLIDHFKSLLTSIAADPDVALSNLRLVSADERETLLSEWGASPAPTAEFESVQSLVERVVQQTPDELAVISNRQNLTYRTLNKRANQLAHYLINAGIGPESFVGVYMDRGVELLIAILAIFKAGAAYLPLDTSFPAERLSFMLQDARPDVLLSEPHLSTKLPRTNAMVVELDAGSEWLNAQSTENPSPRTLPEHAVYVIYTSGSTGTPKGIIVTHQSVTGFISWQINRPGFSNSSRTLQYSSLSFDVSIQEIFSTWCSGGALVCVDEEKRRDFVQLAQTISDFKVERLFLPYVALRQLAEATQTSLLLREVIVAGEQLKITPAIKTFFAQLDECRLFNQYGPAETHVVNEYPMGDDSLLWESLPPIGRPIASARLYVIDGEQQILPTGVAGELYIGGVVARSYLNRPELTAERFLPDPFSVVPGARMYRTGDIVKYRSDGNLEFIGRRDEQLKIRGFRVEPGEIEVALVKHPLVAEAIVVPAGQDDSGLALAAYVVPATRGQKLENLRDFLKETLPDYMIPSHFVMLDNPPLTPTGKVDRLHLPPVERTSLELKQQFVAPRSPLEEQIAQIWGRVLGIPNPGIHDNFFALGGHSLTATQLVSLLRSECSIEIPVRVIFEAPTIAGLSLSLVRERVARASADDLPALLGSLAKLSDDEVETILSKEAGASGAT